MRRKIQIKITSQFINWTPALKEEFSQLLAKGFVTGGVPFNFISNPYFIQAFKLIGAEKALPDRKKLVGPCLTSLFDKAENILQTKIADANYITLMVDGWKNIRGFSVLNFIVALPQPFI